FPSRRRHTRFSRDWSSDVCSSDLRTRLYLQDLTYDAVKGRADQNPEQVLLELQTGAIHDPAAAALMYRESGGNPAAFNSEGYARSEERRVGKGWRGWWVREQGEKA